MYKRLLLISGLSLVSSLYSVESGAHARWTLDGNLPPRSSDAGIKSGPCGNYPRSENPTVFTAGETITVTWEETINHAGYFIISFSPDGEDNFAENILVSGDELPDNQNNRNDLPHVFSTTITLPDTECDQCVLQLIQFMERSQTNYYSCADIILQANVTPPPEPPAPEEPAPEEPEPEPPAPEEPVSEAPINLTIPQLAEVLKDDFADLDNDGDNNLSFAEISVDNNFSQEQFNQIDTNFDGFISIVELNAILQVEETDEEEDSGAAAPEDDNESDNNNDGGETLPDSGESAPEETNDDEETTGSLSLLASLLFFIRRRKQKRI